MPTPDERSQMLYLTLSNVPDGQVITYGDLSRLSGYPNGARWAGRVLSQLPSKTTLPWYRVVNSKGEITCPNRDIAKNKLLSEGVIVRGFSVSLKIYRNRSLSQSSAEAKSLQESTNFD